MAQQTLLSRMVSLALLLISIGAINATQVMHRPTNFKTQLKANAPFAGNMTVAPRIEITKRGTAKANLGYFVNWYADSTLGVLLPFLYSIHS
jgi:hypothetical protein